MSVTWCLEETWDKTISPSRTLALIKWQSTSMCLLLSWKDGFLASWMAERLS